MRRKLATLAIILLLGVSVSAQELIPIVQSYTKTDYGADSQNWAVDTDSDGIVYVANNRGLLVFDGYTWEMHQMPRGDVVRAVLCEGERVYVGGYEEFGYFRRNGCGQMEYISLSTALGGDYRMQNDEIWRILRLDGRIVFQAFKSWFILDGSEVKAVESASFVEFFSLMDGEVYARAENLGFSRVSLEDGTVEKVKGAGFGSACISILPAEEGASILVTFSDGIYVHRSGVFTRMKTEADDILRAGQVNTALRTADGSIIIGTRLSGAVCIGKDGKLLWHINSSNSLASDTVLQMTLDLRGNLWMALGSGVAMANLASGVSLISGFKPGVGDIYSAVVKLPYLYLGTSEGLFKASLSGNRVTGISRNPEVGSFVLELITTPDGQLFAGTGGHSYEILPGGVVRDVSPVDGGSCSGTGIIHGTQVLVQGTFTRLCIYLRKNGRWVFSHSVDGFMEPVKTLKVDYTGTIWAGHLHGGLYAIKLTPGLREVASVDYYPGLSGEERTQVNVLSLGSRVVFTDGVSGFYTYDDLVSRMVPFDELNRAVAGFPPFNGIVPAGEGRYWFTSEREAVLMEWGADPRPLDVVPYSMLGGRVVDAGQRIFPVSDGHYLFTLENALAVYSPKGQRQVQAFPNLKPVSIRVQDRRIDSVDSLLSLSALAPKLPYRLGNISFRLAYPSAGLMEDVRFMAMLENLDHDWIALPSAPVASYRHLPSGSYVFHIQARTYDGTVLSSWDWPFTVKAPLWQSGWAKAFYFLVLALIIYGIARHSETMHREQLATLERLKLESEVALKSKELASITMAEIHRNEDLIHIREELTAQKSQLGKAYPDKYYARICSLIDSQLEHGGDWAMFERNFDNIHKNFFANLRSRYPSLTDTDLRFCAYLHQNLSSKDMASLMNISVKGVEAARSRIRKKLLLPSDKSLTAFMIELE